jgi:hypothetical protein
MVHTRRSCEEIRLEWYLREHGRFPEPAELLALRETEPPAGLPATHDG